MIVYLLMTAETIPWYVLWPVLLLWILPFPLALAFLARCVPEVGAGDKEPS